MYEIQAGDIRFSNGKIHSFPVEIAEAIEFDDAIVVRLVADFMGSPENIFGLDHQGNLLWKMPTPVSFAPYSAYVGLFRNGSFVEALNWDGHLVTLQPSKGFILGENHYNGGGGSHHRTPSVRRWV